MGSKLKHSRSARRRGEAKKRRVKRAERRATTASMREARNEKMRAEEHPGWIQPHSWGW